MLTSHLFKLRQDHLGRVRPARRKRRLPVLQSHSSAPAPASNKSLDLAESHHRRFSLGQLLSKPIVLIAEELSPATVEALGPDFDVRRVDGTDRAALFDALADANAVLIRSATKMDAEAVSKAPKLKVIARAASGSTTSTSRLLPQQVSWW